MASIETAATAPTASRSDPLAEVEARLDRMEAAAAARASVKAAVSASADLPDIVRKAQEEDRIFGLRVFFCD